MPALDSPIYGYILIGRRGTTTLFPAAYLAMGGAAASSAKRHGRDGGLPDLGSTCARVAGSRGG
jgi:hypothetical protein